MASPVAPAATMGLGAGQAPADAAAAAQVAQGQWPGADPSSYYSNYWGGKARVLSIGLDSNAYPNLDAGYYGQQAPGAAAPDAQGQV